MTATSQTAHAGADDPARDLALVRGALAARREHEDAFVARMACVPRIVSALNARMGTPLDAHACADLTQDTLVLIWRKLSEYDGRGALESWVFGMARLEFQNAVRRVRRAPVPMEDVGSDATSVEPSGGIDGERLRLALARLDRTDSRVIELHHFQHLTLAEAGRHAGLSLSATKGRYYRALERLHEILRAPIAPEEDAP